MNKELLIRGKDIYPSLTFILGYLYPINSKRIYYLFYRIPVKVEEEKYNGEKLKPHKRIKVRRLDSNEVEEIPISTLYFIGVHSLKSRKTYELLYGEEFIGIFKTFLHGKKNKRQKEIYKELPKMVNIRELS